MKKILLCVLVAITLIALLFPMSSALALQYKSTQKFLDEDASAGWGSVDPATTYFTGYNLHVHKNLDGTHVDFNINVWDSPPWQWPDPQNPPPPIGSESGSFDTTRNVFTMQNDMSTARLNSVTLTLWGPNGPRDVSIQAYWTAWGQLNTNGYENIYKDGSITYKEVYLHQDTGSRVTGTLVSVNSKIVFPVPPNPNPGYMNGKYQRDSRTITQMKK